MVPSQEKSCRNFKEYRDKQNLIYKERLKEMHLTTLKEKEETLLQYMN